MRVEMLCHGCDKMYPLEELAPFQRNPDGTLTEACRKCIGSWIKEGILYPMFPFWFRKEGKDVVG